MIKVLGMLLLVECFCFLALLLDRARKCTHMLYRYIRIYIPKICTFIHIYTRTYMHARKHRHNFKVMDSHYLKCKSIAIGLCVAVPHCRAACLLFHVWGPWLPTSTPEYNHFGKMFGRPSTAKRACTYNLAVLLLGKPPTKMRTYVHQKHTRMFIVALPISVKNWKQTKSPSRTEQVNKRWHSRLGWC